MIKIIKNIVGGFIKSLDALMYNAKKIPWILAQYAFLFILIFILLDLLFGAFLFYRHVFLAENKEPEITFLSTKFKEDTYQSVLKIWEQREDTLNGSSGLNYSDPFK